MFLFGYKKFDKVPMQSIIKMKVTRMIIYIKRYTHLCENLVFIDLCIELLNTFIYKSPMNHDANFFLSLGKYTKVVEACIQRENSFIAYLQSSKGMYAKTKFIHYISTK